jgi:hypothetical protein
MSDEPRVQRSAWFWPLICFAGLVAGVIAGTVLALILS